jgi:hypothetical protein
VCVSPICSSTSAFMVITHGSVLSTGIYGHRPRLRQ